MTLIQTLANEADRVCHFGELDDYFYIMHRSGKIEAYTTCDETLKLIRDGGIQLAVRYSPAGFALCKKNKRLYIGNRITRDVTYYKVTSENSEERKKSNGFLQLKEEDAECTQRLSTTPEGRLVVLVAIEKDFSRTWHGRIDIHGEDGQRVITIAIPAWAINPWCVTLTGVNTYTLTYGQSEFGLIKLDTEGTVLSVKKLEPPCMPRSLKHFYGTKCIYVLDASKRLLLQMDMEMNTERILYDWRKDSEVENDDNTQPMRMVLIKTRTLMVVGMQSGRVNLYKLGEKWLKEMNGTTNDTPTSL